MVRRIIILLLSGFISLYALSQPIYSHSKWFKVEDGLPQSYISGIQQDQDGFLWIGTRDGLARYDGRSFRVFRQTKSDTNSLSSNTITGLYLDAQNLLWIFYINQKVDCFDPHLFRVCGKDSFQTVRNLMAELKEEKFLRDARGKFWFHTINNGIVCYDPVKNKTIRLNQQGKQLHDNSNLVMTETGDGKIALFTEKGLELINLNSFANEGYYPYDSALHFQFNKDVHYKASIANSDIFLGDDNRIIVFNTGLKKFSSVQLPQNLPQPRGYVRNLFKGYNGDIYVETAGNVFRLEKNKQVSWLWQGQHPNPFANDIRSFWVTNSGVIWMGTNGAGLNKIDLRTIPFLNVPYKNNFVTDNLSRIPGFGNIHFPAIFTGGKWAYTFRYRYDHAGNIFLSYAEVMNREDVGDVYIMQHNRLEKLPPYSDNNYPVKGIVEKDGSIISIDKKGNLAIWNDINKAPRFIPTPLNLTPQTGDVADLEVADGKLWISTEKNGLYVMENEKITHHYENGKTEKELPIKLLTDLCTDPVNKEIIWIGTLGAGLVKWNVKGYVEKLFTTENGLSNNTIYGIVKEKNGKLWLSTNNGITRFDPATLTAHNFDVRDGLIGNEYNRFHHFIFPDGKISFGGFDGSTIFDPVYFEPDHFPTKVQFTRFLINNQPLDPLKENRYFNKGLNLGTRIELPYHRNFLQVEFAGLQFNQPEKIRYRYQLKGYDDDWTVSGHYNIATYTRVPPGRYTLLVNASNTSGEWSPDIKSISIRIRPPIWASSWAFAFYGLLALLLVRTYWKYRENRIRLKNEIALEHSKTLHLQEMDEMKERFFSNITHELRTPLTLIISPLTKLQKELSLSPVHQQSVSVAIGNAEQLLKLINQLLDVSKLAAGEMKLHEAAGQLDLFIQNIVEEFQVKAKEKQISLTFDNKGNKGFYFFDEDKLKKIISNLISNALKFTLEKGKVHVEIDQQQPANSVLIRITDNGLGIDTKHQSRIFERFYMVDDSSTRKIAGTGIGLSLVKDLVQFLNGKISLSSMPGKGSSFLVELPLHKISTSDLVSKITSEKTKSSNYSEDVRVKPVVLVAEDNDELKRFILQCVSSNATTIAASNGIEAWELVVNELPDIVISDLMMPGMNGNDLCKKIKADSRTAHICVIMLTAKAAHSARMDGLAVGVDEYLTKPFHVDELEQKIENLLKQQENWRDHLRKELLPQDPTVQLPHINDIFLQHLYKYMDEKLDDPALDVEQLAKEMHMSRRTLNRKLKALLDISPNELIRRYRLQRAAAILSTGQGVAETAYSVGFETASYFTQCFKEQFGQTPSEFTAEQTA